MGALVVYDSAFGNTEKIAQAIGQALVTQGDVQVRRVSDVKLESLAGLELLVVGSPTQRFRPTAATIGFLTGIPADGLRGVKAAAFDTRIPMDSVESPFLRWMLGVLAKLFGYAAEPIADRLERMGGELVVPPEGFYVGGTEGPLVEGELQRALDWAGQIAAQR